MAEVCRRELSTRVLAKQEGRTKINWAIYTKKLNKCKLALVAVRDDVGSTRNMADIIDN
jgi:hypothetical protein